MLCEIIWNERTLPIAFGCAIPIIAILAGAWYKIEKTKSDNALKQRLVERGMSAADIEKVLAAKGGKVE